MLDLNEFLTRILKIDVFLEKSGWDVEDKTRVLVEIDTKQSNFVTQEYRTVSETLRNSLESRYIDYLLLDQWGKPLAIIEAKRTCKDPLITASTQASQYANDIKARTGEDVFIYLSNGYEIWFWNRPHQPQRPVKRFHTRENLEKMKWQNRRKGSPRDFEIRSEIVDRPISIECAKRVLEHFEKGHRKALIVMATGTGKTRVAMAIIDVLMRASWVKRALFIADRKALRNQAYNKGFKQFFPHEAKTKVFSGEVEKEARLYATTIQTMQECYQEFSPGFFDLIISDEAHRSIFNKWRDIFTYFDSLQIGLTATPADFIERSSFRFFECEGDIPISMYEYQEAVDDGILCDFRSHIMSSQAHFQIGGLTKDDIPHDELLRVLEQNVNPDEINFEGTDFEKKFVTLGTNEALVKEFFDFCLMDESGTLPAKTIFFAISKKHARRLLEAINRLRPEYGGELARVIVSDDSRAMDSIKDFTDNKFPRIAISVDMLDTGIDIPEVCNLVFAKPVFSYIKFWQMIGRGTRSNITCDHHEWLPNGKKEYFKIFDFWNNFEFFEMKPEGDTPEVAEAITNRIFRTRLAQLKYFMDRGDTEKAEEVKRKILDDIKSLPMDSIGIQDSMSMVEKALSPNLWESYAIDPIDFLHREIAPLMRYKPNVNLSVAFFTNKVERLAVAILNSREEDAENLKKSIATDLECLPTNLTVVQDKIELLNEAKSRAFWNRVAYEDTQMLIREFAELMKYKKARTSNADYHRHRGRYREAGVHHLRGGWRTGTRQGVQREDRGENKGVGEQASDDTEDTRGRGDHRGGHRGTGGDTERLRPDVIGRCAQTVLYGNVRKLHQGDIRALQGANTGGENRRGVQYIPGGEQQAVQRRPIQFYQNHQIGLHEEKTHRVFRPVRSTLFEFRDTRTRTAVPEGGIGRVDGVFWGVGGRGVCC